jgi:transaldolase/glucose-6-phosphate isomerase
MNRQSFVLGASFEQAVEAALDELRANGTLRRLWRRDKSLWTGADEDQWLGWLDSADASLRHAGEYDAFAQEIKQDGFTDALLLGMGGSSLGPEALAGAFGAIAGRPRLRIVDSTDPAQVRAAESAVDLGRTLFIVSSKSGSTTEPNILKDYFFARVASRLRRDKAGRAFVAVTDPGSSLEKAAAADGFRRVFHGEPSIGGRYSVLSPFGLVPAAATGIDVRGFLEAALVLVRACGPDVTAADHPGARLGAALAVAARQGRDKVTMFTAPRLGDFGAWAEQLLAESTGKNGKGLIPVNGEPLGKPDVYGRDRFFIDVAFGGETDPRHAVALTALAQAGHPVVRIVVESAAHIGQEFFRFEMATAIAGALLGINPFDQPDVEVSKVKTRELVRAFEDSGQLPSETAVVSGERMALFADPRNAEALRRAGAGATAESWLKAHFASLREGDYAALLAFIARDAANENKLTAMRVAVRDRKQVATTVGFGPRFLHSTGQAYKGGPNTGVFLQITADDAADLAIPGHGASFGIVKAAQARGDFAVLAERGRRALRVHLKGDLASGLDALGAAIDRALA